MLNLYEISRPEKEPVASLEAMTTMELYAQAMASEAIAYTVLSTKSLLGKLNYNAAVKLTRKHPFFCEKLMQYPSYHEHLGLSFTIATISKYPDYAKLYLDNLRLFKGDPEITVGLIFNSSFENAKYIYERPALKSYVKFPQLPKLLLKNDELAFDYISKDLSLLWDFSFQELIRLMSTSLKMAKLIYEQQEVISLICDSFSTESTTWEIWELKNKKTDDEAIMFMLDKLGPAMSLHLRVGLIRCSPKAAHDLLYQEQITHLMKKSHLHQMCSSFFDVARLVVTDDVLYHRFFNRGRPINKDPDFVLEELSVEELKALPDWFGDFLIDEAVSNEEFAQKLLKNKILMSWDERRLKTKLKNEMPLGPFFPGIINGRVKELPFELPLSHYDAIYSDQSLLQQLSSKDQRKCVENAEFYNSLIRFMNETNPELELTLKESKRPTLKS